MTTTSSNSVNGGDDRPIVPNTGGEIGIADIVGRDELVADLLAWLAEKGSVRIEDPRRIGKTSVLRLLASHATERQPIVYVTVQGYQTTDEVVLEIARKLHGQQNARSRFAKLLKGVLVGAEVSAGPLKWSAPLEHATAAVKLERTLAALSGQLDGEHLIIAVDELPWAISNVVRNPVETGGGPAEAGTFLQALQRLRANYPDIRWVFAGSIGFHHVLRLAGETNAVLSGLRPVSCGPLTSDASERLIRRLQIGADMSPDQATVAAIADASGGIPFIAHHLVELAAEREDVSSTGVVPIDDVFNAFVLDKQRSAELTHLLQRLDIYMSPAEAEVAQHCLDVCAQADATTFATLQANENLTDVADDELRTVLDWLIDDHYLVEERLPTGSQSYRWRYDVLRKVWIARRRL